jgi:hypothetical protein
MGRGRWAMVGALLLAACGGPPAPGPPVATPGNAPPPPALSPPQPPAEPAVGPAMAPAPAAQAVAPSAAELPAAMPAGAIYACVAAAGGERQVSPIELAPKVSALCARNPEMGPCQYAREACRRSGGRVFAADGQEITRATEAEYDKRVLRIRLKSG